MIHIRPCRGRTTSTSSDRREECQEYVGHHSSSEGSNHRCIYWSSSDSPVSIRGYLQTQYVSVDENSYGVRMRKFMRRCTWEETYLVGYHDGLPTEKPRSVYDDVYDNAYVDDYGDVYVDDYDDEYDNECDGQKNVIRWDWSDVPEEVPIPTQPSYDIRPIARDYVVQRWFIDDESAYGTLYIVYKTVDGVRKPATVLWDVPTHFQEGDAGSNIIKVGPHYVYAEYGDVSLRGHYPR